MNVEISAMDHFYEMEELVKKTFLYTEEKIDQFRKNNKEQETLRETVQRLQETITDQAAKIVQLDKELDKNEEGRGEQFDLQN